MHMLLTRLQFCSAFSSLGFGPVSLACMYVGAHTREHVYRTSLVAGHRSRDTGASMPHDAPPHACRPDRPLLGNSNRTAHLAAWTSPFDNTMWGEDGSNSRSVAHVVLLLVVGQRAVCCSGCVEQHVLARRHGSRGSSVPRVSKHLELQRGMNDVGLTAYLVATLPQK